jgi:hypothetical protein
MNQTGVASTGSRRQALTKRELVECVNWLNRIHDEASTGVSRADEKARWQSMRDDSTKSLLHGSVEQLAR